MMLEVPDKLTASDAASTLVVWKCVSAASLTVMVWEILRTFDTEVELIWRRPITRIKGLYLVSRYFGLALQMIDLLFISETIAVHVLLLSVVFILMARVYALYNRSYIVATSLSLVVCLESASMAAVAYRVFALFPFDSTCHVNVHLHGKLREVLSFGGVAVFTQFIIWTMTMTRRAGVRRDEWVGIPLLSLIARDGVLAFAGISAVFMGVIVYASVSQPFNEVTPPPMMTALSILACRLVINMQKLASPESTTTTSAFELTTFVQDEPYPSLDHISLRSSVTLDISRD